MTTPPRRAARAAECNRRNDPAARRPAQRWPAPVPRSGLGLAGRFEGQVRAAESCVEGAAGTPPHSRRNGLLLYIRGLTGRASRTPLQTPAQTPWDTWRDAWWDASGTPGAGTDIAASGDACPVLRQGPPGQCGNHENKKKAVILIPVVVVTYICIGIWLYPT